MCLKCEPCRSETATGTWTLRSRRASDSKRINPAPVRMPLRLNIRRKLTARSDRAKSVDVHPDEPWILCRWVALCHVDDSRDCAVSDPCFLGRDSSGSMSEQAQRVGDTRRKINESEHMRLKGWGEEDNQFTFTEPGRNHFTCLLTPSLPLPRTRHLPLSIHSRCPRSFPPLCCPEVCPGPLFSLLLSFPPFRAPFRGSR